jgi:hypothetical protein
VQRIGAGLRHFIQLLLCLLGALVALPVLLREVVRVRGLVAIHDDISFWPATRAAGERLPARAVLIAMTLDPQQAHDQAGKGSGVIGWALDEDQRKELLMQFRPNFAEVIADHVTLAAGVRPDAALPAAVTGEIVGRIDDGAGVEALVVSIGCSTDRPGGGTYHITWSLDKAGGREAKESNDVIARLGWEPVELPMPVTLRPARWP